MPTTRLPLSGRRVFVLATYGPEDKFPAACRRLPGGNIGPRCGVGLTMITLALVGIVSGIITAVSPCVLPVLPAILATAAPTPAPGTASSEAPSTRRPYLVVAGLVTSFGVFTLVGGSLLGFLHLPADFLRWTGIVVLSVVGLGLLIRPLGDLLSRPFERVRLPERLRTRGAFGSGGSFGVGVALGLVFVPCAGPILAAITVVAATAGISWNLVVLTAAFCLGLAIPLLAFALAGRAIATRIRAVRARLSLVRQVSGAILVATSLLLTFNVFEPLQRLVPGVLADAQDAIEGNATVQNEIANLTGADTTSTSTSSFYACSFDPSVLRDCGPARGLPGITAWLNTADLTGIDGAPLTLESLRGRVVLLDFWTYSCINCQRTLPYIEAWNERYAADGLVVIGVHTPEFAFEHVEGNVVDAASRLGVTYPIALDNDYATWTAWDQRYWPAHYLIDRDGEVRQVNWGEGYYAETEKLIQQLLDLPATPVVAVDGSTVTGDISPETYLGYNRLRGYYNDAGGADVPFDFTLAADPPRDTPTLGGTWTITPEYALAGDDATLAYRFRAADVYLVLGGSGTVRVTLADNPGFLNEFDVSGTPILYTLYSGNATEDLMTIEFTPGIEAYAFTFG